VRCGRAVAGAVLAPSCLLCADQARRFALCDACRASLPVSPPACPVCALPSPSALRCGACQQRPRPFCRTISATLYAFPVDRLLQAYKYGGALPMAAVFADLLADVVATAGDDPVDAIVPVPLAAARLRERGFNQAHEIARRLVPRFAVPVRPHWLVRTRTTAVQADLAHDDRARNVRGAFAVAGPVAGLRIAVVDDVMTTGATLEETARVLRAAGAAHVENWVVARALLDP